MCRRPCGGPCDFSVGPSPFGLDFATLDFGLGLDNYTLPMFGSEPRTSELMKAC